MLWLRKQRGEAHLPGNMYEEVKKERKKDESKERTQE
jgi:hypothetical protein